MSLRLAPSLARSSTYHLLLPLLPALISDIYLEDAERLYLYLEL